MYACLHAWILYRYNSSRFIDCTCKHTYIHVCCRGSLLPAIQSWYWHLTMSDNIADQIKTINGTGCFNLEGICLCADEGPHVLSKHPCSIVSCIQHYCLKVSTKIVCMHTMQYARLYIIVYVALLREAASTHTHTMQISIMWGTAESVPTVLTDGMYVGVGKT